MFLATVNEFKGEHVTIDRSGNAPLILNVLGGKCPSKRIISQGWADTQGMEVGKSYLIEPVELDPDPTYGRQFQFNKVQEATLLDIVDFTEKYPKNIYDVSGKVIVSEKDFKKQQQEA
jgi:autonomous glycyl radical cofactor GrcA